MPETVETSNIPDRRYSFQEVPTSLADELVALLFQDTHPTGHDSILYIEPVGNEMVSAVSRYFENKAFTEPPEGVVVTPDPDVIASIDASHIVATKHEDFLGETTSLASEFDYILAITPYIDWDELDRQQRREYAQVSAQITPTDESVNTESLFAERGLHFLGSQGHAAFLTTTDLKTDAAANPFLSDIVQQTEFVEAIDPTEYDQLNNPHMLFRVQGSGFNTRQHDDYRYQPDPNAVEDQLFTAAGEPRSNRTVQEIATVFEDLDLYTVDADASFVYFDMLYEDYDTALLVDAQADDTDIIAGIDVSADAVRGYVVREDLTLSEPQQIGTHQKELDRTSFIGPQQPLDEIFRTLGREGVRFRYVGSPDEIHGLVTRFDLNKFPVYQYFYEAFTQLEIGLRRLIRTEAPDWDATVENVHISTRSGPSLVSDDLAEGKLSQLIHIVQEIGLEQAILTDIHGYEADLNQLNRLRSAVAHYNPIVHTMTNEVPDKRSAPQLYREHKLLSDCISGLS